ncbi:hypothetical protein [Evansella cellulosilytica]|uniref:hypothetical protein n=1 Tax=Evansella cellulosilytica TaxID=1413 RepID=UPI00030489A3|nr:hypothetical protein [Evansella cellulosilytica]
MYSNQLTEREDICWKLPSLARHLPPLNFSTERVTTLLSADGNSPLYENEARQENVHVVFLFRN